MKKILYITINKILEKSGGGIGAKRIYSTLKNLSHEENLRLKVVSLDGNLNESTNFIINKTIKDDIISRLCMHSNYMYTQFKNLELINEIKEYNPDIVFISSSRLGFVADKLRENGIKNIVGFFDNIEYDYVDAYALKFKGIKQNLFKLIEKNAVYRDEYTFIKNIDTSVFLNERDRNRSKELYGLNSKNNEIIPICVEEFKGNIKQGECINLVFIGSLSYGSNVNAIEYFLENIWESICKEFNDIKFIVAGGNPSERLINKLKQYKNVELKANFINKEDVVNNKSIFISPIKIGAGMKVKVAEALSMGLPIIASKETLVGYEEIYGKTNFVFEANDPKEYIESIKLIKQSDFKYIRNVNKQLYDDYYSYQRIKEDIKNIIDIVL